MCTLTIPINPSSIVLLHVRFDQLKIYVMLISIYDLQIRPLGSTDVGLSPDNRKLIYWQFDFGSLMNLWPPSTIGPNYNRRSSLCDAINLDFFIGKLIALLLYRHDLLDFNVETLT